MKFTQEYCSLCSKSYTIFLNINIDILPGCFTMTEKLSLQDTPGNLIIVVSSLVVKT